MWEVDRIEMKPLLDLLAEAPRRIAAAARNHSETDLKLRTDEEPWSVNDILAYRRATAEVRENFSGPCPPSKIPPYITFLRGRISRRQTTLNLCFTNRFRAISASGMRC